jgi:nucleoid-associated protein YgaU
LAHWDFIRVSGFGLRVSAVGFHLASIDSKKPARRNFLFRAALYNRNRGNRSVARPSFFMKEPAMSVVATQKFSALLAASFSLALIAGPALAEEAKPASDLAARVLQAQIKADEAKKSDAAVKLANSVAAPPASGSPSSASTYNPATPSTPAPRPAASLSAPPSSPAVVPGSVTLPPASTPPSATVVSPKPIGGPAVTFDPSPKPAPVAEPVKPITSAKPAVAPVVPTPGTYTIAQGDTFGSIAKAKYGDENKWHILATANPGVDSSHLRIGQVIKLPDPAEHEKARAEHLDNVAKLTSAPAPAGAAAATPGSVTVEPGDTLSSIAKRVYGDSKYWRVIFDANHAQIDHADDITVGMKLAVPPKPVAKAPAKK